MKKLILRHCSLPVKANSGLLMFRRSGFARQFPDTLEQIDTASEEGL